MSVQEWSENIVVVEMQDDPAFADDLASLSELVQKKPHMHVVLDLSNVSFLNSSNIARLIELRENVVVKNRRKLMLCSVGTHVWGIMLVSELHRVFDFADSVAMGLAAVQIVDEDPVNSPAKDTDGS